LQPKFPVFFSIKEPFCFFAFSNTKTERWKRSETAEASKKKVFVVVVDQSNTFYIKFIFFCQVVDNVRFFPFILKECFAVFCYIFELPNKKRLLFFYNTSQSDYCLLTYSNYVRCLQVLVFNKIRAALYHYSIAKQMFTFLRTKEMSARYNLV
jgi:hypothetical protein